MAKQQQPVARKQSRTKRDEPQKADPDQRQNGHDDEAGYEQELAGYLQERIKPGLNSGAIPLLARSIAKEIAHRDHLEGESEDSTDEDEPSAETDDEPTAEAEDEQSSGEDEADDAGEDEADDAGEEDDAPPDFEAEMHDFQAELGEEWILRFSVQGDDAWLTAEKDDGSQRIEAPNAEVLSEAVGLLNEGGGRSS